MNGISELYFLDLRVVGLQIFHLDKSKNKFTAEVYILRT